MKIAHVSSEYYPTIGGVGQVAAELARRQVRAGHEVHVFTSDWDKIKRIKTKEEIIDGVHVHRLTHIARIGNFSTIWPSLFLELLKNKFDIIHSHCFGHLHVVISSFAAKLRQTPHVHTTHCPWTSAHRSTAGRMGVLLSYNTLSRLALKMTNKIIAITPWEINFIKKFGGTDKNIIVIPNGMSNNFFSKSRKNDFKDKHNISGKLVLFFGRLNVTKGPDKFVEIAKSILKKRKDVFFVIRGPDEGMRAEVKRMIGDEKRIILLTETRDRDEIVKMYQAADIFVIPSYREGLPLTLFEAMASGLPVVASPVNGIAYEIKEPENGFLVKYGNNQGFEDKISSLLDNASLRKKISENNIKKSKDYSWDIISDRTLKIYSSLSASYHKK